MTLKYTLMLDTTVNTLFHSYTEIMNSSSKWYGGAMVLGAGASHNLNESRARAYCACNRCGWGGLDILISSILSLLFLPLSGRRPDTD